MWGGWAEECEKVRMKMRIPSHPTPWDEETDYDHDLKENIDLKRKEEILSIIYGPSGEFFF